MSLSVLLRDEWIIAIDKPSGIAVHRTRGDGAGAVAMTLVRDQIGAWVYPVHRLDRGTSGVLVFALDPETAGVLSAAFREGRVAKTYRALCRGVPAESGTIDHPVPGDEDGVRVPAVTEFRRLWDDGRYAWVELYPRTGRYHQIRRHMKHISCPLIGDVRYGKGEHNRLFRERYGFHRLALHAVKLELPHPKTGEALAIEAPLPAELRETLRALGSAIDER